MTEVTGVLAKLINNDGDELMPALDRWLYWIFLPFTGCILILNHLYSDTATLNYVRFSAVLSIFLVVLIHFVQMRGSPTSHRAILVALLFASIAEFFLSYIRTRPELVFDNLIIGMGFFMLAYLSLTRHFNKSFRLGKSEFLTALIFLIILFFIQTTLILAFADGFMKIAAFLYSIVLCLMVWSGICTLFKAAFSQKESKQMALASILIFISDLGIAYSLFHPAYAGQFIPWLEDLIWVTYLPAWTLLAVTAVQEGRSRSFYR
jgi:hypothetical protein